MKPPLGYLQTTTMTPMIPNTTITDTPTPMPTLEEEAKREKSHLLHNTMKHRALQNHK